MTDLQLPAPPASFAELIALWPSVAELARDLGLSDAYERVKAWKREDYIPGHYWLDIERAASRRGLHVSVEIMAELAAARKQGAA